MLLADVSRDPDSRLSAHDTSLSRQSVVAPSYQLRGATTPLVSRSHTIIRRRSVASKVDSWVCPTPPVPVPTYVSYKSNDLRSILAVMTVALQFSCIMTWLSVLAPSVGLSRYVTLKFETLLGLLSALTERSHERHAKNSDTTSVGERDEQFFRYTMQTCR